jgi:hypothetical protein
LSFSACPSRSERLHRPHHVEHRLEIAVPGTAPGRAHAEARRAGRFRAACGLGHLRERQQRLVLHPGGVTRRLRAVGAVLGAAAGLDRQKLRQLHFVGREVLPVHALRAVEQLRERQLEQREHGVRAPGHGGGQCDRFGVQGCHERLRRS